MTVETKNNLDPQKRNRLVDAVRDVKIAVAERSDVVVEMKEADRARLEILAQELDPIFSDVPADDDRFDFALSSGLQPRLWIDATAQVIMGKDRRQYRFIRDTRMGRIVLAESNKTAPIVEQVTKYIAERLYERELAFAGDDVIYRNGPAQRLLDEETDIEAMADAESEQAEASNSTPASPPNVYRTEPGMAARDRESQKSMSGLGWFLIGLFIGAGMLMLIFRNTLFPVLT